MQGHLATGQSAQCSAGHSLGWEQPNLALPRMIAHSRESATLCLACRRGTAAWPAARGAWPSSLRSRARSNGRSARARPRPFRASSPRCFSGTTLASLCAPLTRTAARCAQWAQSRARTRPALDPALRSQDLFRVLDKNADGEVTRIELSDALSSLVSYTHLTLPTLRHV